LPVGYAHWMIKFPSSNNASDVGRIEYAYSLMARDAGIVMPETFLVRSKNAGYFGVRRLIATVTGAYTCTVCRG
jgi:serine/threonine-protein kinase HipA